MKHSIEHSVKLFFSRINWKIKFIKNALIFGREAKNYEYLINFEKRLKDKIMILKKQTEEPVNKDRINILQIKLDLINQILSYVNKR